MLLAVINAKGAALPWLFWGSAKNRNTYKQVKKALVGISTSNVPKSGLRSARVC